METPSFKEDHISQIPALQLLQKLGYTYLTPEEAEQQRGKLGNVLLEGILAQQLREMNTIEFRGQHYPFSNDNIHRAVQTLKDLPLKDGLIRTNEQVYNLLTLGKSFEENLQGDRKSFTLQYIDWKNRKNNVFHVTEEYSVERSGTTKTRRPDIVLFVNGIPLCVIECKRPDLETGSGETPIGQAISQHLRNQKLDQIPQLFIYSQLLLAISKNDALYATAGSQPEFWAKWREDELPGHKLSELKNQPLEQAQKDKLFQGRFQYVRKYFDTMEEKYNEVTKQDRLLYSLCTPERLLELTNRFIVYDAGVKKIARYQQYFTVKTTLERVKHLEGGKRKGGVIWHTQGSGKSLTMVMLAKAIAMDIPNPRIVLVTDRISLDDQIYRTFQNCDKEVVKATTGKHLFELIKSSKDQIITTIINKFDAAIKHGKAKDESPDVFVLVDESHRSQYGIANVKMQKVLPNACFIGFTGTPIMKKEKNTVMKFGGLIEPAYTIDQAVKDKAVVPLLYEGRHVIQDVNKQPMDTFFDLISEPLTEYQRADLKKKYSKADQLNEADQKVWRIAWDVSKHFADTWQGSAFKGQLTAPSKRIALKYKEYMDEIGKVKTEVLISPPDTREGHDSIYDEGKDDKVQAFWKKMMQRFGSEKEYNTQIINGFKNGEEPEIIIVVDKLLTGFDAPRNTVLYICRSLRDHTLLQAIARVNRVYEGKDYGYIIDYYGILGNLEHALNTYSEAGLTDFDAEDIEHMLVSVREEIEKLPERHSHVWDIFKGIPNRHDEEAYEKRLADREVRDNFYESLSLFARTFKVAMSTLEFINNTPEKDIERYKNDVEFFLKLRVAVKRRYSDSIDYKQYEQQIQKLIDTHVTSSEVTSLTELVNIFEKEKFEEEVEKVVGTAARADMIASRTAKTINERMEEDPAFYKKFSELLEDTIYEYRKQRIDDVTYLKRVTEIMNTIREGKEKNIPGKLKHNAEAHAFYGIAKEKIAPILQNGKADDLAADVGLEIDKIIRENLVVDWQFKEDVQNKMKQSIEDYLYDRLKAKGIEMDFDAMDDIIDKAIDIAKRRY